MAKPTDLAVGALKRFARYLKDQPRLVFKYPRQQADTIEVYSDTDWAGCVRTRRSISGGCIMMGSHLIKGWSTTQAGIALSSGEAEYYNVVRAAALGLGQQALYCDGGFIYP